MENVDIPIESLRKLQYISRKAWEERLYYRAEECEDTDLQVTLDLIALRDGRVINVLWKTEGQVYVVIAEFVKEEDANWT